MIRQVYETLKEDYRKGDFILLTNSDRNELNIDISDEYISLLSKYSWKKYVKEKVKIAALTYLVTENESKDLKKKKWT